MKYQTQFKKLELDSVHEEEERHIRAIRVDFSVSGL